MKKARFERTKAIAAFFVWWVPRFLRKIRKNTPPACVIGVAAAAAYASAQPVPAPATFRLMNSAPSATAYVAAKLWTGTP